MELFGSDSEHCMVAEKDGKVVGFVLGTTIEKKRSSWRYGYLVWLGVAPDVQRLGVGRRLFHAFYDLMCVSWVLSYAGIL
jgi:ribosomal protein S18 acetylase RimI-like enzyme